MPKSMRNKKETTQYLSDKKNMKAFVNKLQKYLMAHLDHSLDEKGAMIWWCHANKEDDLNYFVEFCTRKHLDSEAAADMFQYEDGERWFHCDCSYLYGLRVDDDGNVSCVNKT